MKISEILFEMATLRPKDTGLSFAVFVSPRAGAKHDARIKVTMPPWGTHPEAIYSLRPLDIVEGDDWLSSTQKAELKTWVDLNINKLLDFWNGIILYDDDLKQQLISMGNAPPTNHREAIIALRASAPKVKSIRWYDKKYHLTFDKFVPPISRVIDRFHKLGFQETINFYNNDPNKGIILWSAVPKK